MGMLYATHDCSILVSLSSVWHREADHKSQCVGQTYSGVAIIMEQWFMRSLELS